MSETTQPANEKAMVAVDRIDLSTALMLAWDGHPLHSSIDAIRRLEAALSAAPRALPADAQTCRDCHGSGFAGHPDSNVKCGRCGGSGEDADSLAHRLRQTADTVTAYDAGYMIELLDEAASRIETLEKISRAPADDVGLHRRDAEESKLILLDEVARLTAALAEAERKIAARDKHIAEAAEREQVLLREKLDWNWGAEKEIHKLRRELAEERAKGEGTRKALLDIIDRHVDRTDVPDSVNATIDYYTALEQSR